MTCEALQRRISWVDEANCEDEQTIYPLGVDISCQTVGNLLLRREMVYSIIQGLQSSMYEWIMVQLDRWSIENKVLHLRGANDNSGVDRDNHFNYSSFHQLHMIEGQLA